MIFNRPFIGIDIGSSAIKVVELRGGHDKKLQNIGRESLPRGAIVDGLIQDSALVESVLRDLLHKLKIRPQGRRAAISLGGSSVIIKKVGFPSTYDDQSLADAIEVEAEQHFQHDINDLIFTWHVSPATPDQMERPVVLVGARRHCVDNHMAVVKGAGFKVGLVDCDVFAQANMFEYNFDTMQGLIALANVGASTTQVSLIGNGQYLYTRDIAIGSEHYTKEIADTLRVSHDHADDLKIGASEGLSSVQPDVHQAMLRCTNQLVGEIQACVDFFFQNSETSVGFSAVNSIFLTGGGSRTFGLDTSLASSLNIPVHVVNPFQGVDIPGRFSHDELLARSGLFGVAIGLALREWEDHL